MSFKQTIFYLSVALSISLFSCSGNKHSIPTPTPSFDSTIVKGKVFAVTKHFDVESKTWYLLTKIDHKDQSGNIVKLQLGLADPDKPLGEIATEFAARINAKLVFNASISKEISTSTGENEVALGIEIINGKIILSKPTSVYTLGIKNNNELVVYSPKITGQEILNDATNTALTGFVPLIENHKSVLNKVINIVGNLSVKNPRQVIGQFDNLDILFLTCGGRGHGGTGMTAQDLVRILMKMNVKFAYNLDGGGSNSTVVDGEFINWKMDNGGTTERPRPNFLYVK